MKKKLALILALSFLAPLATVSVSSAASNYSDLAVGDPLAKGYRRPRKKVAKPAAATEAAAPKSDAAPAAPAAEKAAEKPADAAK